MTWQSFWWAIGTFLTSPGAGIIAAVATAYFALVGVSRQAQTARRVSREDHQAELARDREARDAQHEADRQADARERWQRFYDHLWANRRELPLSALLLGAQSLKELVETQEQSAMLEVFVRYLADQDDGQQTADGVAVPKRGDADGEEEGR